VGSGELAVSEHVVLGHGEVGTAVATLLDADWVDLSAREIHAQRYRYLHIAIPFGAAFDETVAGARREFSPALAIIHSTVPLGTSDRLGAVHSPVRGVHPNLLTGLRTFVKFFGGPGAEAAAQPFIDRGVACRTVPSASDTEAMKLWETTQYGVFILLMQEIRAYCESHGLDFGTVYTDANVTYNAGYQALGKHHLTRPLLKHMGAGIGGHCVRENAALLPDTLFGDLVAQSPRSASANSLRSDEVYAAEVLANA
jgi:hypothetical protein